MIFTDTSIPVKADTMLTREYWIAQAKGHRDDYGNPFRVITLRWNWSELNKTTGNEKTRGFEDAIISKSSKNGGGFRIRYRRPGSVVWKKPIGGVGGFMAECPNTPHNIKKLIACYPNNTWYIVDDDIRKMVEEGWNSKLEKIDPETRKKNEEWFKSMHTSEFDFSKSKGNELAEIESEKKRIENENLMIAKRKQEQDLKEAELNEKEQEIVNQKVINVKEGKEIVTIAETVLQKMKLHELKKVYKSLGLTGVEDYSIKEKPLIIAAIIKKQSGEQEVVQVNEEGLAD